MCQVCVELPLLFAALAAVCPFCKGWLQARFSHKGK
jgi:hypothetical protein